MEIHGGSVRRSRRTYKSPEEPTWKELPSLPDEISEFYIESSSFYLDTGNGASAESSMRKIDERLQEWYKTRGIPNVSQTSPPVVDEPIWLQTLLQQIKRNDFRAISEHEDERMDLERRATTVRDNLQHLHNDLWNQAHAWRTWWVTERSARQQSAFLAMKARYVQLQKEDAQHREAERARRAVQSKYTYDNLPSASRRFRLLKLFPDNLTAMKSRVFTKERNFEEVSKPKNLIAQGTTFPSPPLTIPLLPSYINPQSNCTPVRSIEPRCRCPAVKKFPSRLFTRNRCRCFGPMKHYEWVGASGREQSESDPRIYWFCQLSDFIKNLGECERIYRSYVAALKLRPEGPPCLKEEQELEKKLAKYNKRLMQWRAKLYADDAALEETLTDAISGSLHTFEIGDPDCPPFEALSYEWNAKRFSDQKSIALEMSPKNYGLIHITNNLHELLRNVRLEDGDTWVWADAVCINQSSPQEKGHQVKLMGTIYTQANKVVAWVPVADPLASIKALKQRHSIASDVGSPAMDSVLRANYWTRKWIIQEVILARTLVILLGHQEFAMQDLANILDGFERGSGHAAEIAALSVTKLAAYRRNRSMAAPIAQLLSELVLTYERNQCAIYQDHVYALYNLVGEHRVHLEVDYTLQPHIWCQQILTFMDVHEPSCRSNMLRLALTLARLSDQNDSLSNAVCTLQVNVRAFDRGGLRTLEECTHSIFLRGDTQRLHPAIRWVLKETKHCWYVAPQEEKDALQPVSRRVLSYFAISQKPLRGLAAGRIRDGDHVWQFLDTRFAFVVRPFRSRDDPASYVQIVGRCYLFDYEQEDEVQRPYFAILRKESLRNGEQELDTYDLRLNISDLYTAAFCAEYEDSPKSLSNSFWADQCARARPNTRRTKRTSKLWSRSALQSH